MKKIVFGILTVIVVLFVSCYEVNEEIVINDGGSGTYVTKMDMSAMISMIQSMAGEEELAKNGMDQVIDTLIRFKTIMDTAKDVTPEQKRLLSDGTMNLQMNLKENVFKIDMKFPFKNYADLQLLMSGKGTSGLGQAFKNVFAKDSSRSSVGMQDQGIDQISNVYDVVVNKNNISRKLNKQKLDSMMQKPEIAQAKQMMGSFEIPYTTTIKLPRAVKKSDNEMIKLSDDKKTVTMKYDLVKMLENPEKFSFSIEY